MYSSVLFNILQFFFGNGFSRYLALIIAVLHLPASAFGQASKQDNTQALAVLDSLERKATLYSKNHPTEKVYIHFDKPFYIVGEDCWYKAYVVRSNLDPTDISSVLSVDWINPSGKIIKHQRLKIENGTAVGDFAIATTLPGGTYTVRAYTHWMRNEDHELFYSKHIKVIDPKAVQLEPINDKGQLPIDLQFFPEGGTLVAGIQTQMAFKAIDIIGSGVRIKGKIVDEKNNQVTSFESTHNGMGVFPFTPIAEKIFRAVLENGAAYQLPVVSKTGLVMTASNWNTNKILVKVQSSKDYPSTEAFIVGHSRGSVCYAAFIGMDTSSKSIAIPKKELPEGVLQLTLFDNKGIPQCERKLFIKKDRSTEVAITTDKEQYAPRDSIMLNFRVTTADGNPIKTSLSVSVTDADLVPIGKSSGNIYTQLLLQSDLKGNIENPGWYFDSSTNEKAYALDLVMLTHGWSRYNWRKILDPASDSISFKPEKAITLEGRIMDDNLPVANVPFTLSATQSENNFFNIYESDSLGYFAIPDLDFSGSTTFTWRVMGGKKGKAKTVKIMLDTIPDIPPVPKYKSQHLTEETSTDELLKKVIDRFVKTGIWSLDNTKILDEVVIKASRAKVKAVGAGAVVVKPDSDDLKTATSQFVSRYAIGLGLAKLVPTSEGEEIWTTPNSGAPITISVDGFVSETTGIGGNPNIILNSIPIEQIEYVVVAGSGHDGYFIEIGTKNTNLTTIKQLIKAKGYDAAREFYHPIYRPLEISAGITDNRMTLYWNAELQTDGNGDATTKFYNTDTTKKLLVIAEGIVNGEPISKVQIVGKED